jgi:SusD family.
LARLYFNAKSYIGEEKYSEAATICQDIIDGKYGKYKLDTDWTNIFGFDNETSPEIIWSVPSENAKLETDGMYWSYMVPYNYKNYLGGLEGSGSNNGIGLIPSLDPTGKKYSYKLGGAYAKFNDNDIRKQLYVYEGAGKYRGMFIVGELVNPTNPSWTCTGSREYSGKTLVVRDQVAYFAKVGSAEYPTLESLPSTIATAEEASCVRVTKRSPRPNQSEKNRKFDPDVPVIRLAEIYYTLAECKMRAGDKDGAAELINTVRKRYFANGNDPDPVTGSKLDKYRMLDEWQLEFLAEGRRRTRFSTLGCLCNRKLVGS